MRNNWSRHTRAFQGLFALLLVILVGSCKSDKSAPAAAESAAPAAAGPKATFESTSHDFGSATEGDNLRHVFTIKNTGSAPLVIERVRTSCGCAVATMDDKDLGPGESTKIEVNFNTRNRHGRQRKTITVITNDPESPHTLEINANVVSLLAFQPRHVQLATSHGEARTREAWLTGKLADKATLKIEKVEGDKVEGRKVVSIELAEKKEGDQTKRGLSFKVKADKVGYGRGHIELTTGVEEVPTLKLWFNWNVTGNLQGVPRNLYFTGRGASGRARVVRVRSKRDDFKLISARVTEGPFKAEIEKLDAGIGTQVRVTVTEEQPDKEPAKRRTGKLQLVSNDPLEPKKTINLTLRSYRGPGPPGPMPGRPPRRMRRPRPPPPPRPPAR